MKVTKTMTPAREATWIKANRNRNATPYEPWHDLRGMPAKVIEPYDPPTQDMRLIGEAISRSELGKRLGLTDAGGWYWMRILKEAGIVEERPALRLGGVGRPTKVYERVK